MLQIVIVWMGYSLDDRLLEFELTFGNRAAIVEGNVRAVTFVYQGRANKSVDGLGNWQFFTFGKFLVLLF